MLTVAELDSAHCKTAVDGSHYSLSRVNGYKKVKGLKFAEVGAGSNIAAVRLALPEVFLNLRYSPVKIKTADENEIINDIGSMARAAGELYSISCVGIDSEVNDQQVRNFINSVKNIK